MPKYTKFRRDRIVSGMWIHVRSNWWLGRGIRFALNKWEARTCKQLGVPAVPVWGNHDGIVIGPNVPHIGPDWGIGEALAEGSVITSLEQYEKDMASGHLEVRVFVPLPRTPEENPREVMWKAACNWEMDVEDRKYDYWAYIGLICQAFLGWHISTDERGHFWCTEGADDAYILCPPDYDLLQDDTPTPMHVEQVARTAGAAEGQSLIPRPLKRIITLQEVTQDVLSE